METEVEIDGQTVKSYCYIGNWNEIQRLIRGGFIKEDLIKEYIENLIVHLKNLWVEHIKYDL
jgi:hypothetical protein